MSGTTLVRLTDYPFATVRFACIRCDRQGMHQKSALIGKHGYEATMLDLRPLLAGCDRRGDKPCGAYYPDLAAG